MPRNLMLSVRPRPSGEVPAQPQEGRCLSGGIIQGKFPSRKNGRMVRYKGLLERAALTLFECSPWILEFRDRPRAYRYPDGSKLHQYTPDFEIVLRSGEAIEVEVHSSSTCADKDRTYRLSCIEAHLATRKIPFQVLSEHQIRRQPRLSNLEWIYHQAPHELPSHRSLAKSIGRVASEFPMPIQLAIHILAKSGVDPFSGILAGLLKTQLDEAIGFNSMVETVQDAHNDWFRISEKHDF